MAKWLHGYLAKCLPRDLGGLPRESGACPGNRGLNDKYHSPRIYSWVEFGARDTPKLIPRNSNLILHAISIRFVITTVPAAFQISDLRFQISTSWILCQLDRACILPVAYLQVIDAWFVIADVERIVIDAVEVCDLVTEQLLPLAVGKRKHNGFASAPVDGNIEVRGCGIRKDLQRQFFLRVFCKARTYIEAEVEGSGGAVAGGPVCSQCKYDFLSGGIVDAGCINRCQVERVIKASVARAEPAHGIVIGNISVQLQRMPDADQGVGACQNIRHRVDAEHEAVDLLIAGQIAFGRQPEIGTAVDDVLLPAQVRQVDRSLILDDPVAVGFP